LTRIPANNGLKIEHTISPCLSALPICVRSTPTKWWLFTDVDGHTITVWILLSNYYSNRIIRCDPCYNTDRISILEADQSIANDRQRRLKSTVSTTSYRI